jgi:NAD(P)-dependent dehydrogenase (short-subunit alcohol dehydrogenase family)
MSEQDWLGLSGAVGVVTGAGRGIGKAVARALAAAGAVPVLLDIDGDAAAAAAGGIGSAAIALRCDVTSDADVAAARDAVLAAHGRIDVLVNNAAYLAPGSLDTVALADWQRMLDVNLTGYLRCAQVFGADMLARGAGAVVHVASIAASQPQPNSAAYSPGKAAVAMLSRQLAAEWGPRGVRSNCVSPGLVVTALSETFYADPDIRARREAMVPQRRIGMPADIADAVLFLASPRAGYITGQDILVDGGLSQIIMGQVPRPGFSDD